MAKIVRPTRLVSERMRAVARRNTIPEQRVKLALSKVGIKWRSGHDVHRPNSADILIRGPQWALFVHGCFWHGHTGCRRAMLPRTRRGYWKQKQLTNSSRDRRAVIAFMRRGWTPLIVWECEAMSPGKLTRIVRRIAVATRNG